MNEMIFEKAKTFFWRRVTPSAANECWEWNTQNQKKPRRYGNVSVYGGPDIGIKCILAHRLSWMIHFGEIGGGLNVCHRCDNPSCVNPRHLFVGSQSDNIRDSISKGRFTQMGMHLPDNGKITCCPAGHPYDARNTGTSTDTRGSQHRYCRACHKARARCRRLTCSA